MKTAGRGNPNRWARVSSNRPDGVARLKQILLIHGGWEVTKIPVIGEVFFLDFPFYRTFLAVLMPFVARQRSAIGRLPRSSPWGVISGCLPAFGLWGKLHEL